MSKIKGLYFDQVVQNVHKRIEFLETARLVILREANASGVVKLGKAHERYANNCGEQEGLRFALAEMNKMLL